MSPVLKITRVTKRLVQRDESSLMMSTIQYEVEQGEPIAVINCPSLYPGHHAERLEYYLAEGVEFNRECLRDIMYDVPFVVVNSER